ncbi:hypothetical protein [Cysteiniphilum litorale]|uniref:hypothetical protein n=1 Tax=Cysteiniphilum litorale TaxID=2056700 RepID=UPI003F880D67
MSYIKNKKIFLLLIVFFLSACKSTNSGITFSPDDKQYDANELSQKQQELNRLQEQMNEMERRILNAEQTLVQKKIVLD